MLIYRGALVYAEDRNHDERSSYSPVELEVLKYGHSLPSAQGNVTISPVVSHGRWLVPCLWCFSASMASRDDHRFFCVECANRGTGGKWVRVVWPASKDEIESLLVMRPDARTRNWAPPETLGDLVVENERHGVM